LLALTLTGEERYWRLYNQVHEYTFATFPHPDPEIGEWIQIRDREGKPESKVVALPVKDPFHIARNLILIIQLLEQALD
jgi:N-acylglucosamine 2-epimerase